MKKLIFIFAVLTIAFSSCRKEFNEKEQELKETTRTMSDLDIDDSFNWKTTRDVTVLLNGEKRSAVFINSTDGFTYHKGIIFSGNEYASKITIPTYVKNVKLVYDGKQYEVPIENGKIEFTF